MWKLLLFILVQVLALAMGCSDSGTDQSSLKSESSGATQAPAPLPTPVPAPAPSPGPAPAPVSGNCSATDVTYISVGIQSYTPTAVTYLSGVLAWAKAAGNTEVYNQGVAALNDAHAVISLGGTSWQMDGQCASHVALLQRLVSEIGAIETKLGQ